MKVDLVDGKRDPRWYAQLTRTLENVLVVLVRVLVRALVWSLVLFVRLVTRALVDFVVLAFAVVAMIWLARILSARVSPADSAQTQGNWSWHLYSYWSNETPPSFERPMFPHQRPIPPF